MSEQYTNEEFIEMLVKAGHSEVDARRMLEEDLGDAGVEDGFDGPIGMDDCPEDEQTCRECGCSDLATCNPGCFWAEDDLCSQCAQEGSPAESIEGQ